MRSLTGKSVFLSIVLLCSVHFIPNAKIQAESGQRPVYVVPISGEVEPAMAAFVKRCIRDGRVSDNPLFILELDTFGGRVDSALQIVDTLTSVPKGETVAFVKTKAISAGALIALACGKLYMKSSTTIGDCAPITYSNEGPKMMGEKFQSPLRAKFRTLARRNGYPETLAESMVTADMVVYEIVFANKQEKVYLDQQAYDDLTEDEKKAIKSKKTVVAKGELLTMDDVEANALGFSTKSVDNIDTVLADMGITSYELVNLETNWSEALGRVIGMLSPILVMIGLAALYTELKAPGFGLPGIVGIVCLALVFLNQYLIGLADYTELLLIMLGVAFLGVELFVTPGFGIMGTVGLVSIAAGMVLAFQDFVIPDPTLPWQKEIFFSNVTRILGSYILAFIMALLFLKYVFPRLGKVIEGPYLATTLEKSRDQSESVKGITVGDSGMVINALRPSGKVEIHGEIVDVLTEGEFIDKGETVKVTELKGNRIFVTRSQG